MLSGIDWGVSVTFNKTVCTSSISTWIKASVIAQRAKLYHCELTIRRNLEVVPMDSILKARPVSGQHHILDVLRYTELCFYPVRQI